MKVYCEACQQEGETHHEGLAQVEDVLPKHWKRRLIDGKSFILCGICGHPKQLMGGFSPYLRDALNISEYAICEKIPEEGDFYAPRVNCGKSKKS